MTATMAFVIVATNAMMLWIGFYAGDQHCHETEDIQSEDTFDAHVHSALWVARRTTPEGETHE
jgi:hypothetical protein